MRYGSAHTCKSISEPGRCYCASLVGASRGGIINRDARYNNYESRLFMKWHGFFSFIIPPGLLLMFPELSLVHCGRADNMDKCEEKDSREEWRNAITWDHVGCMLFGSYGML